MVALALALVLQLPPMKAEMKGVWCTEDGVALVINSTHSVQMVITERHLYAGHIGKVPDGTYSGEWTASRSQTLLDESARGSTLEIEADYGSDRASTIPWYEFSRAIPSLPTPNASSSERRKGRIQLQEGRKDGFGKLLTLDVKVMTSDNQPFLAAPIYPLMPIEQLTMAGNYSGGHMQLSLKDRGGRSSYLTGTLIYDGKSYLVRGTRVEARAGLSIVDASTGKTVTKGVAEWAPTPGRVKLMHKGDSNINDRLLVAIARNLPLEETEDSAMMRQ